jgi:AcrR family transcriptional regulator
MSDLSAAPGLRERKRLATRRAIQVAVLDLIGEHGLEAVTVDMISRRADVSPRTFFNYFTSKEEAVVGDPPQLSDGAELDAFVADHDGSLLDGLVHLLDHAATTATTDRELVQRRRAVLRAYPELFARRMASVRVFEERVTAVVAQRLASDGGLASTIEGSDGLDGADSVASRANLVALVVIATLRHAWAEWIDDDDVEHLDDYRFSLRARMDDSFADLRRLVSREL